MVVGTIYIWPNYGDRNFIHGSMSVDVSYDRMYTKLLPIVYGYTQTYNFDPEIIFALANVKYDNSDPDNGNDYMRVGLGIDIGGSIYYYFTYINPEIVDADGCYDGDY